MKNKSLTRRDFIYQLGLGSAAVSVGGLLSACSSPAVISDPTFRPPDVELGLSAIPDKVQIFPGAKTNVWRYRGEVLSGSADAIQTLPDSYLGPILHLKRGQSVRVHFTNQLNEPSIIHWHGLHVPESADGHPRLVVAPGQKYIYDFTVADRAGTYWFHPHPHGRTGPQVYNGLAGLFIISDDEEAALGLPSGDYDLPLVIQDRTFNDDNQLIYGSTNMMGQMVGFLGNQILINGQPDFTISAENRPYRLRLLNGSNSRIYKLAWDDGMPFTIIGTDGGLLEKPVQRNYIALAPAQRIELWADFSSYKIGSQLQLINLSADTPSGGVDFPIMSVSIDHEAISTSVLPEQLSSITWHQESDAVNRSAPRDFLLSMGMGMAWNINGRTFKMEDVAKDEVVRLGDLEVWRFTNAGGRGMGMTLPHPMHIHGLQFQVLNRQIDPSMIDPWSTISEGLVDEGWHDTVLVMPGERVHVLLKFEDFTGLYMYHCHNLEHVDMGMMRNYLIEA